MGMSQWINAIDVADIKAKNTFARLTWPAENSQTTSSRTHLQVKPLEFTRKDIASIVENLRPMKMNWLKKKELVIVV